MYQIVIVDDHPDQVESIALHLPLEDLNITALHKAYSGTEALRIIQEYPVQLVVTDIRMPGMDGIQLIEKVSELPGKIRCILLTGYAEFDYARKALRHHAIDYLLKPIDIEELTASISKVITGLEQELEEALSYQRASYTLRENLPLLRDVLLRELLQGRRYSTEALAKRMESLEIPLPAGAPVALMAVRMEETVKEAEGVSLLEFAVSNMAEEIFAEQFLLWKAKDEHNYLVYAVVPKDVETSTRRDNTALLSIMEHMAALLQKSVKQYLKRNISVVAVKQWADFPSGLKSLHEQAVMAYRQQIGDSVNLFLSVREQASAVIDGTFTSLYQPPLLIHLLETAQWTSIAERLSDVFTELEEKWKLSSEYMPEVYCGLCGAFYYYAHKNGQQLNSIIGQLPGGMPEGVTTEQSVQHMQQWAYGVVSSFREQAQAETRSTRYTITQKINTFIEENLSQDISLQMLSDHIGLHPAYISKIYKMETGVGISEYIVHYRMELASAMLRDSQDKIYEIGEKLGYITSHYFIKVFKKHFGITPQEYRDRI